MSLVMDYGHTYFTLNCDKTTTSQIKKQLDILVRYYSDNHNEVRVRFLKAAVFGHAYAESVANELCDTLQKFSLSLKYLLSLSYDGPNVNKTIKININSKLSKLSESWLIQDLVNYIWYTIVSGKELTDMVQMWKICILIYTTFLSCHHQGGNYADVQQKLNLDEFVFLRYVQSWWPSLIPAIERVRKWFPALKEHFRICQIQTRT